MLRDYFVMYKVLRGTNSLKDTDLYKLVSEYRLQLKFTLSELHRLEESISISIT